MELLAYLEDGSTISLDHIINPLSVAYADPSDYSKRYPLVVGHPIGIVVSSSALVPIQATGTGTDVGTTNTGYVVHVTKGKIISGT